MKTKTRWKLTGAMSKLKLREGPPVIADDLHWAVAADGEPLIDQRPKTVTLGNSKVSVTATLQPGGGAAIVVAVHGDRREILISPEGQFVKQK